MNVAMFTASAAARGGHFQIGNEVPGKSTLQVPSGSPVRGANYGDDMFRNNQEKAQVVENIKQLKLGQERMEARLEELLQCSTKCREMLQKGPPMRSMNSLASTLAPPEQNKYLPGTYVDGSSKSEREAPLTPTSPPLTPMGSSHRPQNRSRLLSASALEECSDGSDDDGDMTPSGATNVVARASSQQSAMSSCARFVPDGWPAVLLPRDEDEMYVSTSAAAGRSQAFVAIDQPADKSEGNPEAPAWKSCARRLVLRPDSFCCVVYDITSLGLLMYDLTVIPVVLAWNLSTEGFINHAMWITLSFWTFDVCFNFFRGYHQAGYVQTDLDKIASRYFRNSFGPDLCIMLADWFGVLFAFIEERSQQASGVKMLRFAKTGRLLRIVRMLRVVKYIRIFDELVDRHVAVKYHIILRISSVLAALSWFTHLLACAWYTLGVHASHDTSMSWPDTVHGFFDHGFSYEYTTSYHWAIAQMVLGGVEIQSVSSQERVFTIFCLVIGLVVGSTLISSLSASMVEFQMSMNERGQMLRTLRHFLRDHDVHVSVAYRVQKQVLEGLSQQVRLTDKDVPALNYVSSALRTTLKVEVYQAHIYTHPLFRLWSVLDSAMVRAFCADGLDFHFLRQKDSLFSPGIMAEEAFTVVKGGLIYEQSQRLLGTHAVHNKGEVVLSKGAWVIEMTLWAHWITVGASTACTWTELVSVRADAISQLLWIPGLVRQVTIEYRAIYHSRIVISGKHPSDMPTDVSVPFTDLRDIVHAMHFETRNSIAKGVLGHEASKSNWLWLSSMSMNYALEEEMASGASPFFLLPAAEGNGIEKVSLLVTLRMENPDGQILAQIGRHDVSGIRPTCQLPSLKQDNDENPRDAVLRLMKCRLMGIGPASTWVGTARQPVVRHQDSSIRIHHLITTFHYHQDESFKVWQCEVPVVRVHRGLHNTWNHSSRRTASSGGTGTSGHSSIGERKDTRTAFVIPEVECDEDSEELFHYTGRRFIYMWLWVDELEDMQHGDRNTHLALSSLLGKIPFEEYLEHEGNVKPNNSLSTLSADQISDTGDFSAGLDAPEEVDAV